MRNFFRKLLQHRREFISLLVGVPSYEKYVAHMKANYPNEPILCEKQFFAEAQVARYEAKNGKVSRCC